MIQYQIRSVQLINLVRDIKNGDLISDAYFQRNLVWREVHKKDLIKTILEGYPFPLIFISKGEIDVEKMSSTACIVDGQQRCNAISMFVENEFKVDGRFFKELSDIEKSNFFKYEIPVCELDILNTDEQVLEIFKRINRTSNSLTGIEKQASEYGASYYMLVCKLLANQIDLDGNDEKEFQMDPNVPLDFIDWAKSTNIERFQNFITDSRVFSSNNIARKVNLQYTLNLVSTYINGFYNRNDKVSDDLDLYINDFDLKDKVVSEFNEVADLYLKLNLNKDSIWFNKANMFSLFIALLNNRVDDIDELSKRLNEFKNTDIYESEYKIYAKEGVNNKKERQTRNDIIVSNILDGLVS